MAQESQSFAWSRNKTTLNDLLRFMRAEKHPVLIEYHHCTRIASETHDTVYAKGVIEFAVGLELNNHKIFIGT